MEWIYTEERKPITYKTGNWDGKNSDQVLVEDNNGKLYVAHLCQGFMDGADFEDWYDSNDWLITEKIIRYLKIPD